MLAILWIMGSSLVQNVYKADLNFSWILCEGREGGLIYYELAELRMIDGIAENLLNFPGVLQIDMFWVVFIIPNIYCKILILK